MKIKDGMLCPMCEAGSLRSVQKDVPFEYKGNVHVVSNVRAYECDICGESLWDDRDERQVERSLTDVRRRTDGLLTTDEIKAIRQRFGMTQVEFARALQVGEKNIARYESGQATQGRSTDNLLRILQVYPSALQIIHKDNTVWVSQRQEIMVPVKKRRPRAVPTKVDVEACQIDDGSYEHAV